MDQYHTADVNTGRLWACNSSYIYLYVLSVVFSLTVIVCRILTELLLRDILESIDGKAVHIMRAVYFFRLVVYVLFCLIVSM